MRRRSITASLGAAMTQHSRTIEILPPLKSDADDLSELERLVDLMDSHFQVPGTNIRLGLDAVVGLIPAIGDGISALVSAYIFQRLRRYDLPWHIQARMVGNILVDLSLGAVPLVGDLVDVAFKANRANLKLARRHLEKSRSRA